MEHFIFGNICNTGWKKYERENLGMRVLTGIKGYANISIIITGLR
jgi:hypothetical protein